MKVSLHRRTGFSSQLCDLLDGAVVRKVERDKDTCLCRKLFHVLVYELQRLALLSDLFRILNRRAEALFVSVHVLRTVLKKDRCFPSQFSECDERAVGHDS